MATVARRCEGVGAGARRSQVIFLPASGILPPDSSGFVISPFLQNTVNTHDSMVIACDLLREAGLFNSDVSSLDDYEKQALKKLNEQEPECGLTGFDSEES
nr:hypothetical protein [Vibrio parahaemolyticus]